MNKESLLEFIAKAHKNTYAAPEEVRKKHRCKKPFLPGHKEYHFIDGDWECRDFYGGSKWAPGKEIVFYKDNPVWTMSYQGKVNEELTETEIGNVYAFLKKALMQSAPDMPFRGPKEFKQGDYQYTFILQGDYKYFQGKETIIHKGRHVFFQDIMGSLIK